VPPTLGLFAPALPALLASPATAAAPALAAPGLSELELEHAVTDAPSNEISAALAAQPKKAGGRQATERDFIVPT
jgi:hypothetical protein